MENDELTIKLQQKNNQMKVFSTQITKLELECVQAKQQLGDALNNAHEINTTEGSTQEGNTDKFNKAFKSKYMPSFLKKKEKGLKQG
jgi:hypothetical protein